MSQVKKADPNNKTAAENRKARFSYEVVDTYEAGLALTGTEVKSLRGGHANIAESYASVEGGEIWLINSYLPQGMTMVPLKIYFNDRGRAKLLLALARGKTLGDKRQTEKDRDWAREKGRLLKERG